MAAGQHDREWPYRLGQTEDPLRQAKVGHAASAATPVTSSSRPSAPAVLSATPVMTSQPPTRTNVSVITRRAASIQPPTSSTGAAADETTPYHGTFRTIVTLGRMHRRAVVA